MTDCRLFFCLYNLKPSLICTTVLTINGPSWPWSYGSWIYNYLCNQCLSPLMLWVQLPPRARRTTLCDKVSQWLVAGRWFSPGPSVSSINKTDHHDITKILLKVALDTRELHLPSICLHAIKKEKKINSFLSNWPNNRIIMKYHRCSCF